MNAQHTPGPWEVVLHKDLRYRITPQEPSTPAVICEMIRIESVMDYTDQQVLANAKLIAVAPDLLEACRRAIDCINADVERMQEAGTYEREDADCQTEALKLLDEAIAKATK
jgi:hypothetical protein